MQSVQTTLIIVGCIFLVSSVYIALGLAVNYALDQYVYFNHAKEVDVVYVERTPLVVLYAHLATTFGVIMVMSYFIKGMFDTFIAPNINLTHYKNVYELYTGSVLVISMVTFSRILNKQYNDIKLKMFGTVY